MPVDIKKTSSGNPTLRANSDWERTFDTVPDMIAIMDINHVITKANKSMLDRFGLTHQEIYGCRCCEIVHGKNSPPETCPASVMLQRGIAFIAEIEEKKLHGFFDVTVSPMFDDDGSITGYVHVMRDITNRKKAEAELKASEEKHRKLANEQRIILNTSSVGISFLKDRTIIWANPAFDLMFGYEPGATQGLNTSDFYFDLESYVQIGAKGYSTIQSGSVYSQDVKMKKKDGSTIWCNIVGQQIDASNSNEGSIWVMLDISDRIKAEEDRQNIERQFQHAQKLESLGVLAGGIAHDFNNILTIILGNCFMLKENMILETDRDNHIGLIESAANRAADLCRRMLEYAGKNPMLQTEFNLWLLVDENVKMLCSAIKKNVTIKLDVNRTPQTIIGDSSQIQQVVMNLIINAAEAIGDNNGQISINVQTVTIMDNSTETDYFGAFLPRGSSILLQVSDNGCGMNEETQQRLFEPFYTTKFTGRGLGMSAILGIIKGHNGTLQMNSTHGSGTTFRVYFPIPRDIQKPDPIQILESADLTSLKAKILLVDDEHELLSMGKLLMETLGFSVVTAVNGREAIELFDEQPDSFNAVVLDVIMPEMGGIQAYHELRKRSSSIPVILCSGYEAETVGNVINGDSNAGFVNKPYNPLILRKTLREMIG